MSTASSRARAGMAFLVAVGMGTGADNVASASEAPADLSGCEVRGNLPGTDAHREDHIWRFEAGGRVTAVYAARPLSNRMGPTFIEESDTGRWQRKGAKLCVTFRRFYRGQELCYTVSHLGGRWYRFANTNGRVSFKGTLKRR